MGVSKNNGIPKSSILIGFSIINHPFFGVPLFLENTHMAKTNLYRPTRYDYIDDRLYPLSFLLDLGTVGGIGPNKFPTHLAVISRILKPENLSQTHSMYGIFTYTGPTFTIRWAQKTSSNWGYNEICKLGSTRFCPKVVFKWAFQWLSTSGTTCSHLLDMNRVLNLETPCCPSSLSVSFHQLYQLIQA